MAKIRMDWSHPDKAEAIKLFRQQCEIVFHRKKIKAEDQVDEILLMTGITGLKKFNSWGLSDQAAKDPQEVWNCLEEYGKSNQNFRVA